MTTNTEQQWANALSTYYLLRMSYHQALMKWLDAGYSMKTARFKTRRQRNQLAKARQLLRQLQAIRNIGDCMEIEP